MAKTNNGNNGATLGFEAELWQAADALRNNMDAAEYKHVVLGLIFLKYVSDAFDAQHDIIAAEVDQGADPEDPDEYRAAGVFWVPREARWEHLQRNARQSTIGETVDNAMKVIEDDNPSLKGVLPKDFARAGLDKERLGQLIDLIGNIRLGDAESRSKDILGRVYEYFLSQFASAEGKKGGQFYTPRCVVRLLVEMLAPYQGRVYDPCCGSGGMFVQSVAFIEAHANGNGNGGAARSRISVYGQESNYTTWRLANMNLAIRGINAQIAHGDSFHNDRFPDLKADYVLANPPFNDSDWRGGLLKEDVRFSTYGTPPARNANYAWVQHFIHHLAPRGVAGFVLANGSMSSNQSGEGEIRRKIVEADLVDCMVALPGQLFYSTQIPVCLWFIARNKRGGPLRDRRGETLFIDARQMGTMIDRTHRELTDGDIARIAGTYHAWRGDPAAIETSSASSVGADLRVRPPADDTRQTGAHMPSASSVGADLRVRPSTDDTRQTGAHMPSAPSVGADLRVRPSTDDTRRTGADMPSEPAVGADTQVRPYEDVPGFCKAATIEEVRKHRYVLTPGRYVGIAEAEEDDEPFEEEMERLVGELGEQINESRRLERVIVQTLKEFGYEL